MKKINIKQSFYGKKFKHGSLITLYTCVFLTALILINLAVGKLNLSKDLTKSKLYSLSEQTNKILTNNKQNITIYGFYESGKEDYSINTILTQYKGQNKNIKVQYVDPNKYPQIAQKYSTDDYKIGIGSLVVESGSNFKVIDPNSLVNYDYSNPESPTAQSIAIEQAITSAVIYVTSEKSTTINTLQGHSESDISEQISKQLQLENYTVSPINLTTKEGSLKEDSLLLVLSPKRDLSQSEADDIKNYLSKGGRALFLMNLTENELPNFQSVLKDYGIAMQRAITIEGNSQYVTQNPIYLLPMQQPHEITNSLINNNLRVLVPGCQSIKTLDNKKSSLTVETLLTTTSDSWGKVNLQTTTLDKEANDLSGPFNIAMAITDKASDSKTKDTKLVVVANGSFTNSQISSSTGNANLDFFMNSVNWIQDKKDNIAIRPKTLDNYPLEISEFSRLSYTGFVVIAIPAIIVIAGVIVWIRRKNK